MNFSHPEDWTFVAICYLASPSEDDADYWEMVVDEMADLNDALDTCDVWDWSDARDHATPGGRYATRGTCDHCGAHFLYGAAYRHADGNVAVVGHTCAAHHLSLSDAAYEDKRLRRAIKAARTRARMKLVREKNEHTLLELEPHLQDDLNYDHDISRDLRASFVEYGRLSDKQWSLAERVRTEDWGREKREEPTPVRIPDDVLEGRVEIRGELLATKRVESMYGFTLKMLVRDERGFKVWGTYPTFADERYPEKGDGVTFMATVEESDDDDTFGFFKRPTKAQQLTN